MNSQNSFTMISGVVAFVLVFVLFIVILMTQSFDTQNNSAVVNNGNTVKSGSVIKSKAVKKTANSTKQEVEVGVEDGATQTVKIK